MPSFKASQQEYWVHIGLWQLAREQNVPEAFRLWEVGEAFSPSRVLVRGSERLSEDASP